MCSHAVLKKRSVALLQTSLSVVRDAVVGATVVRVPFVTLSCRLTVCSKPGCSGSDVMNDTELIDAPDVEQWRQTIQCTKDIAMLQFTQTFSPKSGRKTRSSSARRSPRKLSPP